MNRINENKLIGEAFKSYRFESSFKPTNKIILSESDEKEFDKLYAELYENLELIKERYPELYNEFIGKFLGNAAGKVVNAGGMAKDYVKSIPGKVANWAKDQTLDAKDAYAAKRNERLSKIPGRSLVQGSGRSGGGNAGGSGTGGGSQNPNTQNLPASQVQAVKNQQYNFQRFSNTFNAISQRGFADQKLLNSILTDNEFVNAFSNLSKAPGFKEILAGRNPILLKLAIASYLIGGYRNRSGAAAAVKATPAPAPAPAAPATPTKP